jgi:hypothetical protein
VPLPDFKIIMDKITSVAIYIASLVHLSYSNIDEKNKISLLYVLTFIIAISNPITVPELVIGFFILSFLFLEVFSDDKIHLQCLSIYDKIGDYIFKLLSIYHLPMFTVAIFLSKQNISDWASASTSNIIIPTLSSLLTFVVILSITSSDFEPKKTEDFFYFFDKINKKYKNFNKNDMSKFNILTSIEDKTFFERDKREHTSLSKAITCSKIRKLFKINNVKEMLRIKSSILSRGHATIEMQIMRTVGLNNGYNQLIRRKFYEFIYADMYFNALEKRSRINHEDFSKTVLMCYIESVPIKLGSIRYTEKTINKLFNKKFGQLSKEEFFVWCLGLPHYHEINEEIVNIHQTIIDDFDLNKNKILHILEKLNKNHPA